MNRQVERLDRYEEDVRVQAEPQVEGFLARIMWQRFWVGRIGRWLLLFALLTGASVAMALGAGDVSITMTTDDHLVVDSNNCLGGSGPHVAYVGFEVLNTSAGTLTDLSVTLSGVDPAPVLDITGTYPTNFALAGNQAASQYIGALAPGASDKVYWLIAYPCTFGTTATLTATVSDAQPGTVAGSDTVITSSSISASAGGLITTATLGPGAVLGQIIEYTVEYSFGNGKDGDRYNMQPVGNLNFDAGCFQLVTTRITASMVGGIDVGDNDQLFFLGVGNTNGSDNRVTVVYSFQYLCSGVTTTAASYAAQTSGNSEKYTGNFDSQTPFAFPSATNPFVLSISATPTQLPGSGGTVTYTITVDNPSAFDTFVDGFTVDLPSGVTFVGFDAGSDVTAANSSSVPTAGDGGTLEFLGIPFTTYPVPAGGQLQLVFVAQYPGVVGAYTTTASITTGTETTGPESVLVQVGFPPVLTVTKSATTPTVTLLPGGATASYSVSVSNDAGRDPAVGVAISDSLPAGFTYAATTSVTLAGGAVRTAVGDPTVGSSTPSWDTFTIPGGGSVTIAFDAAVAGGTAPGSYDNSAAVTSVTPAAITNYDGSLPANTADDVNVQLVADLAVTKTNGATTVVPGTTTSYTITVTNNGPSAVSGASVTDSLDAARVDVPAASWSCAISSGSGSCGAASGSGNLATTVTLQPGATATYTLLAPVLAGATGTLSNTASAAVPAGATDPTPGNDSAVDSDALTPQVNLGVVKDDGVTNVTAGTSTTYTITITNPGPSDALGVGVSDPQPASTTSALWSCVATGGASCTGAGGPAISDTIDLPAGGQVVYSYTVTVDSAATGTLLNTVSVSMPPGVTNIGSSSDSDSDTIDPPPPNPPFVCDGTFYLGQAPTATDPTQLTSVDGSTSPFGLTNIGGTVPGVRYNAIGFNLQDGYMYGIDPDGTFRGTVYRIDRNGVATSMGVVTNLPTGSYFAGDVAEDGTYYVYTRSSDGVLVTLDVSGAIAVKLAEIPVPARPQVADLAFNPIDGNLYGFDTGVDRMVVIDPASGAAVYFGATTALGTIGGAYFDGAGNFYGYQNSPGAFYRFDVGTYDFATGDTSTLGTGVATFLSNAPNVSRNDGAACPFSPQIEKWVTPGQVQIGGVVTYTFRIGNPNSFAFTSVSLQDTLTNGRTYVAGTLSNPFGGTANNYGGTDTLIITNMILPPKTVATITVDVQIPFDVSLIGQTVLNQGLLGGIPVGLGGPTLPSDNPGGIFDEPTPLDVIGFVLSGRVYEDLEPNSAPDAGEDWSAGANVQVNLLQGGAVIDTLTLTPGSGAFTFGNLPPGSYDVIVTDTNVNTSPTPPTEWLFINPISGSRSAAIVDADVPVAPFGLFHGSVVSGTVFLDDGLGAEVPNDALQGAGEAGLPGVTVTAASGFGSVAAVTDGSGNYQLYVPASLGAAVNLSHARQPATGSSVGGSSACLAVGYADPAAANRLLGDLDCSGAIDGAESGFAGGLSYSGYDFGVVRAGELFSDQAGQASSPGLIAYDHLFRPGTQGSVTVQQSGGLYSYQVFVDEDCDGSFGAAEGPHALPYAFAVGPSWSRDPDGRLRACALRLQVSVPAGEPAGETDVVTLAADLQWLTNPAPVVDVRTLSDTTTIVLGGKVDLVKGVCNVTQGCAAYVATGAGRPGEVLEYRISYDNSGADTVTNLVILDPVPLFTDLALDQYGSGEVEVTCPDSSTVTLETGAVSQVSVDVMTACGLGALQPGDSGSVRYRVVIR